MCVTGPMGMGKTALLDAVAARASAAGLVVRRAVAHVPDAVAAETLAGGRDGPGALLVDDVDRADRATLEALARLARRLVDAPVLMVVAGRSPPVGRGKLAELMSLAAPERTIELGPLSARHTAAAIARALRRDGVALDVTACHRVTGGSPLHAVLLAAELNRRHRTEAVIGADEIESAAEAAFAAFIDRAPEIDETQVRLLAAAAAFGDRVSLERAARTSDCDPTSAVAAATSLAEMGLIAGPDPVELLHERLGRAALARLGVAERSALYMRVICELRDDGAGPEAVAANLLGGGGDADEAIACLRDAARAAGDDAALRTRAVRELAAALAHRGEAIEAAAVLEEHIEQIAAGPRDDVLQLELDHAALAPLSPTLHDRVRKRLVADRWRIAGDTPVERALLAARVEHEAVAAGDADAAAEHVLATLEHAPLLARGGALNAARTVWLLLRAERFGEAARLLEQALVSVERGGAAGDAALFHAGCAYLQLQLGDMVAAERAAREALDVAEPHGSPIARDLAAAYLARALLEQDRLDEAIAAIDRASLGCDGPPPPPSRPGSFGTAQLLVARGHLRVATGQLGPGLSDLLEVAAQKRRIDCDNPAGFPWLGLAVEALVMRGDRERAREIVREPLAAAERWGSPAALAQTLAAAAHANRDRCALERAAELVRDSSVRAVRAEIAVQRALLRVDEGGADAARDLAAAASLAESCGMARLAGRARAALAAGRSGLASDGLARLSDRELEVVGLVVEGMTNRQIAEALSISPRTVQIHVANAMEKVGARRRTELATFALRQGAALASAKTRDYAV